MTHVSKEDVLNQARLSGLELTEDEITTLTTDIPRIVEYFEQLNELDTEDVEPTCQVNGRSNVWREDTIESSVDKDALLKLAPQAQDDQIQVTKVL